MSWLREFFDPRNNAEVDSRVCTVSFTNMTGYVGIAEHMSLEKLPVFMNRYFETQTLPIQARNGLIDKYIGDMVVGVWTQSDVGAQLACEAALDQVAAMTDFYEWANNNGYPCPGFRVGINSGLMRIGEFGTKYRRNYTVMGDEVNFASRLEGLAKYYGIPILISGATRERLTQDMVVREVERVCVIGRDGTQQVFELVCRAADLSPQKRTFLELYQQGLDRYLEGNVSEALKSFEAAQKLAPDDRPSEILRERCRQFL